MFGLAVEEEMLSTVPPLPTVIRNARQGFFTEDEIAKVLAALPADIAPAIEFAYITGRRSGEIRKLTWKDHLDLDAGAVRLRPGETKKEDGREFPLTTHPRLRLLIHQQVERAMRLGKPWLFGRDTGEPLGTFRKAWATACKVAGCPGRLVHNLRRTAVRNLVLAGVPERVAMTLTGHRTRHVFDGYHVVSIEDRREAVAKLAKHGSGA